MNQRPVPIIPRHEGTASSANLTIQPRVTTQARARTKEEEETLLERIEGLSNIEQILAYARLSKTAASISDIHLGADDEIWVTIDDETKRMPVINGIERITSTELTDFIQKSFPESGLADLHSSTRTYATTSKHDDIYGTIRIHAMHSNEGINVVIRLLSLDIPTLDNLGLPKVIESFAHYRHGLILFTGATGSGKSTAVAALIDLINTNYAYTIYCVEDPIEYVHASKRSRVRQQTVGKEVPSYQEALRSLLRAAPKVIFIGEMRDAETMRWAIAAAETGHLVISTLHDNGATESVQRVVGSFDAAQAREIQIQFAHVLKAIVGLRLIPKATEDGRIVATEILVNTPAIKNKILKGDLNTLRAELSQGREYGMHTLEDDLKRLVRGGIITVNQATEYANVKDELEGIRP